MKKLIALILIAFSATAMAQHRLGHYHHHHGGHGGWGWVAPAIIGGAVVYAATRPAPPPPPSVVYVPNPQPQVLPPAPVGFRYEQILDANCNCYRWVLVQG